MLIKYKNDNTRVENFISFFFAEIQFFSYYTIDFLGLVFYKENQNYSILGFYSFYNF